VKNKERSEERSVLLIETGDRTEAQVMRLKLEAFGVPCSTGQDGPGSAFGWTVEGLTWSRIFVPESELALARDVIKPGMIDRPERSDEEEEKKE
jgi:hypothetical protein